MSPHASLDDRIILPYRHLQVTQLRIDHQLTLLLGDAQIVVNSHARLSHGVIHTPGASVIDLWPEQQDVAPILALFGTTVLAAVAFKTGHLRIVFSTGHHLNVSPHEEYEAWEAAGPGSLRIVATPGSALATWA